MLWLSLQKASQILVENPYQSSTPSTTHGSVWTDSHHIKAAPSNPNTTILTFSVEMVIPQSSVYSFIWNSQVRSSLWSPLNGSRHVNFTLLAATIPIPVGFTIVYCKVIPGAGCCACIAAYANKRWCYTACSRCTTSCSSRAPLIWATSSASESCFKSTMVAYYYLYCLFLALFILKLVCSLARSAISLPMPIFSWG